MSIFFSLLDIFFICISNVIPFLPPQKPPISSLLLLSYDSHCTSLALLLGINLSQHQWYLFPLMPYKAILCFIFNWRHESLHVYRTSQEIVISGYFHQALPGICHRVWVWWLYMGRVPRLGRLWMTFPSVYASQFVSQENFAFLSRKDRSVQTLVFLLLEHHLLCELYFGYSELLG